MKGGLKGLSNHLGTTLKRLRKDMNMTQWELADRIGINRSSMSMYERGERTPLVGTLEIIAKFFNVSTDYLLGNDSQPQEWQDQYNQDGVISKVIKIMDKGHDYVFHTHDVDNHGDFALRITGDSMEPFYNAGDVVIIKSRVLIEPGQIGLFFLNGQGYIRMFQGNKLAPIKAGHKTIDIKQDAEFIPIGRVVAKM